MENNYEVNENLNKESSSQIEELVNEQNEKKKTKVIEIQTRPSFFSYFLGAMVIFGICFVSFFFVFQILLEQIGVHGYSMLPTINSQAEGTKGDKNTDTVFYIDRNSYDYEDIVIIAEGKTSSGTEKLIKRVIAVPGQTITFKCLNTSLTSTSIPYEIYINGKKLEEDYILEQNLNFNRYPSTVDVQYPFYMKMLSELKSEKSILTGKPNEYSVTLGKDEYFVMGDNRNNSIDSRYFGPVKENEILGKVVIHVEYDDSLLTAIFKNIFATRLLY